MLFTQNSPEAFDWTETEAAAAAETETETTTAQYWDPIRAREFGEPQLGPCETGCLLACASNPNLPKIPFPAAAAAVAARCNRVQV